MDAFHLLEEAGDVPPADDATIAAAVDLVLTAALQEHSRAGSAVLSVRGRDRRRRQMTPAGAAPPPGPERPAAAGEKLTAAIGAPAPPACGASRRPLAAFRGARPGWRLAAAGLTVALAAGALTGVAVTSRSAAPAPQVMTVADVANLAANAAARQPNTRPGQWVYRKTLLNTASHGTRFITQEAWTTADATKGFLYSRGKLVTFLPALFKGCLSLPTYRSLGSLPADPRALVARLSNSYFGCPPSVPFPPHWGAFSAIAGMLEAYVLPPRFAAELYRALADIPGVRLNREAADIAGRHGIGFVYPMSIKPPPVTYLEIIISGRTYTYIGSYDGTNVVTSKWDGMALLRQALVSGPGVRP